MENLGFTGIQNSFIMKPGKVTLLRLIEDVGDYHFLCTTGEGLDSTKLRQGLFPALDVITDCNLDELSKQYAGQHFAICYGDVTEDCDILTVNHELLWSGRKRNKRCEEDSQHLPLVREYLQKELFFEGTALANLFFGGKGGQSGIESNTDKYQLAGVLKIIHMKENVFKQRLHGEVIIIMISICK